MMKKLKIFIIACLLLGTTALTVWFFYSQDIAVLNPKGIIALKQRNLMITATWLMLIVVIPVFIMTAIFAWKYRESNKKADYKPNWDTSHLAECFWWGVPCIIVLFLALITWSSSHELSPYKPIVSDKKPLTIQVVALQWKWLFIYPEQNIASLNFVQFPANVPINFEITADAPMNSFWIPQLGGQIYAMPAMKTELHLMASETGDFRGSSSNISGDGFAGMVFTARASSEEDFEAWVDSIHSSDHRLTLESYNKLVNPSQYDPPAFYILKKEKLFDEIIMKYLMPMESTSNDSRIDVSAKAKTP